MHRAPSWIPTLILLTLSGGACASTADFQGMTAQEIYDQAVEYLEAEEWDSAIDGFETLLFGHPTFDRAAEARMQLADAFFGKEQYLSAASEYERVVARFPNHEVAPEAALGVCRSHVELSPIVQRDQEYTRQAILSCGLVPDQYPGTRGAQRAIELRDGMIAKLAEKDYQRAHYYYNRGFYDSALVFLEDVLERYPDSPAAPKALLRMYETYREIGYSEDAEAARRRLLEEYPDSDAARQLRANANGETDAEPQGTEAVGG